MKEANAMASARQDLANKIYEAVRSGTIVTAGKLPTERELAALFGASRSSIREALVVLETLGVIKLRGKEGMFVSDHPLEELTQSLQLFSSWPVDAIPQAYQTRIILEGPAAAMAARSRTDEDLRRMEECLLQLTRIYESRPADGHVQGNRWNNLFHKLVITAAHNQVLLRVHEGISAAVERIGAVMGLNVLLTPYDQWPERLIGEHRAIGDAIAAGDERLAQERMERHLQFTSAKMERLCVQLLKLPGRP